jgi:hypothetical protein
MRHPLVLLSLALFLLASVLLGPSCNSRNSNEKPYLCGKLDTLYISASTFSSIQKRIAFRFYIKSLDSLTMHGWPGKDGSYGTTAAVILQNGRASDSLFEPGDYLGNLILRDTPIDIIDSLIALNHSKYVLFAPLDPKTHGGQICYEIFLTSDNPSPSAITLTATGTVQTGVTANPSPPRNGN